MSPEVQWASMKFGVFICTLCSSFHRKLGAHITKVKNLRLDDWYETDADSMEGNEVARQIYEKYVPVWYRRLVSDDTDPEILREHWIRTKYERKEFKADNYKFICSSGHFSVQLQKKCKDNYIFRPRKFTVLESSMTLSYYKNEEETPICTFNISDIEVALAPDSLKQHPSSMQLSIWKPNTEIDQTRHIFVRDDKPKNIINLYMEIRRCKLLHLQTDFPYWPAERILFRLPCDFKIESWLFKTGPRPADEYRRRWVTLMKRTILYHKNELDPTPRGGILLASNRDNHAVAGNTDCALNRRGLFPFSIHTSNRVYRFAATSEIDQLQWINAVNWTLLSQHCEF